MQKRLFQLAFLCAWLLFGCRPETAAKPDYVLYSNIASTTPQLPWLKAVADGSIRNFTTHYWRSQAELQALLLSGRGDVWLAPVDVLLRAQKAGAPLEILCVAGWRKWTIIGTESLELSPAQALSIASAPPDNPGATLLKQLLPNVTIKEYETKSLLLRIISEKEKLALIAEPMVSMALAKNSHLKRIVALEDLKAQLTGGENTVPWAAYALNTNTLKQHPELKETLYKALSEAALLLSALPPAEAAAYWKDKQLTDFIPWQQLADSLQYDVIKIARWQ